MPDIDERGDIDLTEVCNLIKDQGFFAYVEQTGGGCATIYAYRSAKLPEASRSPMPDLMAGPGAFDWNGSNHIGYRSEFNWGSASADPALVLNGDAGDDEYSVKLADLESLPVGDPTPDEPLIADRIVADLREAQARWGERTDMIAVPHRLVPLRDFNDYCNICGFRRDDVIHREAGA